MSTFEEAIETDVEGVIAALDLARQLWEPDDMVKWFKTPQSRWNGESPLARIVSDGCADDVTEVLENTEMYS